MGLEMPEIIRSFVAIDIDNEKILNQLRDVQGKLIETSARIKSVKPENIHITIRFLGDIHIEMIDKIHSSMEKVSFTPFDVRIHGIGAFPTSKYVRIVWAGIEDGRKKIEAIFNQLEPQLRVLGFKPDLRGFSPHITISRVRAGQKKAELIRCVKDLANHEFGILKVCCLKLKKSVLTPRGPIYSNLKEVCRSK